MSQRTITRWQAILGTLLMLAVPLAGALEVRGKWQQGGLLLGTVAPGTAVVFEGRSVDVSPAGDFVIGLGRDAPPQVTLVLKRGGERIENTYEVAQRDYDIQRIEGVPQRTVTPPESELARIREEARLVRQARGEGSPRRDYLAGFERPLAGPITGVYGSQRFYNGEPRRPHFGLDIAAPAGTPVSAPADGLVRLVHDDMYFSGGTLIIDHGHGVSSTFIHLSEILVGEGQRVQAGDRVARVGATGRATGPHLDWRINWFDVRIDPALVLDAFPRREPPVGD